MKLLDLKKLKMKRLEKLTQDEDGTLHQADGRTISPERIILKGKIRTLVVANPCLDISNVIDEMTERNSVFVPEGVHAYVASDFSGDTQHLRKSDLEMNKKFYCVFAVQFCYIYQYYSSY
ncbi:hypothetical protein HYT51_02120 [Candidatus Woesearchaeota archaeon]|nr:hypothetical protein [Candidatus Woesearchaeota archaeon]